MFFLNLGDIISKDDFLSKLIPSWPSFVAQVLALAVMMVVVILVAYKPVKKLIKEREDHIEENIRNAEKSNALALQKEQEATSNIIVSQKEAFEIVNKAKENAENERLRILEKANLEANKKLEAASKEIEQMKLEAKEEMRKEMINLALDASKEVLKRNVTSVDNMKIADDFIKSVEK